ncbi:MAG: hypothetical protein NWP80_00120 [Candidatus Gracilibacteria bacterium]|nr:hypothetical protein [Candidatus Gracilibacteria bacterium]
MSEFTPVGKNPKMTKSQIRKYQKEMEEKRRIAQIELEKAKLKGEFSNEEELKNLEEKLDDIF